MFPIIKSKKQFKYSVQYRLTEDWNYYNKNMNSIQNNRGTWRNLFDKYISEGNIISL